MEQTYSRRKR